MNLLSAEVIKLLTKNISLPPAIGVCTKEECKKNIGTSLPPIRTATKKDEDKWCIKGLPSDWSPVNKQSGIIERLDKKKAREHTEAIEEMLTQRKLTNINIEKQIWIEGQNLREFIEKNKVEMIRLLQTLHISETQLCNIKKKNFTNLSEIIQDIHNSTVKSITKYHAFLKSLERGRSETYKNILQDTYKKLHIICYKMPYELQQYFEEEILGINEIILCNLQCYDNLKEQLILQCEENVRKHLQELIVKEHKWKNMIIENTIRKLRVYKESEINPEDLLANELSSVSKAAQEIEAIFAKNAQLPITSAEVENWAFLIHEKIAQLDNSAKDVVELYKTAIGQLYRGYHEELQNIAFEFIENGVIKATSELEDVENESFEPFLGQFTIKLEDINKFWNKGLQNLKSRVVKTITYLKTAAHLWDSHYNRVENARSLVLKDLNNTIDKNDKLIQVQEIQLNKSLDELRQASNEVLLEKQYDYVLSSVISLQNIYNAHYNAEVKIIEKYKKLTEIEVDLLLKELNRFIEIYPKDPLYDPKVQRKRASQCSLHENDSDRFIPKQMKMCEYQVEAVHNWMFGLGEAIEKYMSTCREEIMNQCNLWVDQNINKVAKRLEIKLALHTPRFERVKQDIYEIRLAEIRLHSQRLQRHKAGIDSELEKIKHLYVNFETQYTNTLDEYNEIKTCIYGKISRAQTLFAVKTHENELTLTWYSYYDKLKNIKENYQILCQDKVKEIKTSCLAFNKHIRLFSEGGNYNPDESRKVATEISKLEKKIKKKIKLIFKGINKKFRKMTKQLERQNLQTINRLDKVKQEFEFGHETKFKVRGTQNSLVHTVSELKFDMKKIQGIFKELFKSSILKMGNESYLENFIAGIQEAVASLNKLAAYLILPEPFPTVTLGKRTPRQATASSAVITKKKKPRKKKKSEKSTKTSSCMTDIFLDYNDLLYSEKPTENESFMSKLCCNIYNSFEELQSDAKEFYALHATLQTKNVIEQSYEDYIDDILAKYQYFHLQCELVWMDLVNDFINTAEELLDFIPKYCEDYLEKVFDNKLKEYKEAHSHFIEEVKSTEESNDEAFRSVHEKLKPLFGYIKNKDFLYKINQEMLDLEESVTDSVTSLIPIYQNKQSGISNNLENVLSNIISQLNVLRHKSAIELLNIKLINQLDERLILMENMIKEDTLSEQNSHITDMDVPERIRMYKKELQVPDQYKIAVEHSKLLLETINNYEKTKQFDDTFCLGIGRMDKFQLLSKMMNDFGLIVDSCKKDIEDIVERTPGKIVYWKNMWTKDMKKIQKLYDVKYDSMNYVQ